MATVAGLLPSAPCTRLPNLWTFIALRLLTRVVAAGISRSPSAISATSFRKAARPRSALRGDARTNLSASLGSLFGEHLAGAGFSRVRRRAGAAVLAREAKRFPEPKRDRRFSTAAVRSLLQLPAARMIFSAVFIEGCFVFGGLAFLATSMLDRFSFLGPSQVGLMLAGYGVGGLFYSITVKRLVPKIGEPGILLLGGTLLFAAYLVIGLMPVWWLFIPGMVLYGWATSCTVRSDRATGSIPRRHHGVALRVHLFPRAGHRPNRDGPGDSHQQLQSAFVAASTGLLPSCSGRGDRFVPLGCHPRCVSNP